MVPAPLVGAPLVGAPLVGAPYVRPRSVGTLFIGPPVRPRSTRVAGGVAVASLAMDSPSRTRGPPSAGVGAARPSPEVVAGAWRGSFAGRGASLFARGA